MYFIKNAKGSTQRSRHYRETYWRSGIDITLKGAPLNMSSLFKIMEQLELLDLTYEIDLSLYAQIENISLLEHIERLGKVIYQRH
jgi:hypothetical protein